MIVAGLSKRVRMRSNVVCMKIIWLCIAWDDKKIVNGIRICREWYEDVRGIGP